MERDCPNNISELYMSHEKAVKKLEMDLEEL